MASRKRSGMFYVVRTKDRTAKCTKDEWYYADVALGGGSTEKQAIADAQGAIADAIEYGELKQNESVDLVFIPDFDEPQDRAELVRDLYIETSVKLV